MTTACEDELGIHRLWFAKLRLFVTFRGALHCSLAAPIPTSCGLPLTTTITCLSQELSITVGVDTATPSSVMQDLIGKLDNFQSSSRSRARLFIIHVGYAKSADTTVRKLVLSLVTSRWTTAMQYQVPARLPTDNCTASAAARLDLDLEARATRRRHSSISGCHSSANEPVTRRTFYTIHPRHQRLHPSAWTSHSTFMRLPFAFAAEDVRR